MSAAITTAVRILDSEYPIRCAEDELDDLMASAGELDKRMREIRDGAKVSDTGRIAIVAALNIACDNLRLHRGLDAAGREVNDLTARLEQAIEQRQLDQAAEPCLQGGLGGDAVQKDADPV